MIKRSVQAAAFLALVAVNVFYVERALEFSKFFPFGRLLSGNALTFGLGEASRPWHFGSEIAEINGKRPVSGNAAKLLVSGRADGKLVVTMKTGDAVYQSEFEHSKANTDVLWCLLLFLLCADMQFLWGFMIHLMHPHRYLARLMVYFTMAVGVFTLLLADLISFGDRVPLLLASGLGAGYTGVVLGYNLTNRRISTPAWTLVLASGGFLAGLVFFLPGFSRSVIFQRLLFSWMVLCAAASLARMIISGAKRDNFYLRRRNAMIVVCMITGFIVPLAFLAAWTFADLRVPVYLAPVMMLVLPLCLGGRLLENTFFDVRLYPARALMLLSMNLIIAFIVSFSLFYIANASVPPFEIMILYAVFAFLVVFLMRVKHELNSKINRSISDERDRYAVSLQNIAELVSSPVDLALKLDKICSEVKGLIDAAVMKLVLFRTAAGDTRTDLAGFIEYAGGDAALEDFFEVNRGIILRHSLIVNYPPEEYVNNFMRSRKAVIALPLMKGSGAAGVMLVGDKSGRGFYSEDEVNYLQTVSMQLYQLIENDRLFNEYILKRRYERELDIASFIQMRLFPRQLPRRRGLYINHYMRPFVKVTGDYFDFITVDRDRTAMVIGDVSGHGLSASMILSMTSSIVHAMLREKKGIERAVDEINHFLNHRYNGVDLISLFIGIYNKATRELEYVNAGHCAPVLFRSGQKGISVLEGRSKILGADPAANYFSSRFTLNKNDEMILYTDGLVEIYHEKTGEQYGEKKFIELITRYGEKGLDEKMKAIVDYITGMSSEAINDDITVIGIKIL